MRNPFLRGVLLAALGLGLGAIGYASDLSPDKLRRMAPSQTREWLQQQAAQQKVRQAAQLDDLDVTGPALTRFDVAPSVDVSLAQSTIWADVKATDDLSGVRSVQGYATGPSGQWVDIVHFDYLPSKKSSVRVGSYRLSPFLEPGTYTFNSAYVFDTAGNLTAYDGASLAALGKATFTVKNKKGFDRTPPSLLAGKLITQQASLTAKQPGTDWPLFIGLTIDVADNGDSALSGVRYAYAVFCLSDHSSCFDLASDDTNLPRQTGTVTLRVGGNVPVSGPTGKYHLERVSMTDYAQNEGILWSNEFGGDTDFSAYFPSTTITLTP